MRIHVLFFGRLKDIVGRAEDHIDLAEGARVEDLFARYGSEFADFAAFRSSVVASVNQEFAVANALLRAGDEVAFLPPVSGGAIEIAEDICELVRNPIRCEEFSAAVKAPADGGVVVFEGIVRNNSQGKQTLWLEYEAYEPMALKQMRAIISESRSRFSVSRMALVHRLGRLDIGETSVLIAVASPHRAAAFDAARFAIEAVKHSVPIWKKEFFRDGAVWVEGAVAAPVGQMPPSPTNPLSDESIT